MEKVIKIELVKSPITYAQNQRDTLKALGLTKMHKVVEKKDTPEIRGMIKSVAHLVKVLCEE